MLCQVVDALSYSPQTLWRALERYQINARLIVDFSNGRIQIDIDDSDNRVGFFETPLNNAVFGRE
ncbi:MAG: hypothetical protein IJX36_03750 [Thermoguttaceae bacterium]|nr:hypothetical protein [Thermoguttaceae bacterium]